MVGGEDAIRGHRVAGGNLPFIAITPRWDENLGYRILPHDRKTLFFLEGCKLFFLRTGNQRRAFTGGQWFHFKLDGVQLLRLN